MQWFDQRLKDSRKLNIRDETRARRTRLPYMSDSTDYLMAHARNMIMESRNLPQGPTKIKLRHIGGIYHLLAKQGTYSNIWFIEDYRAAKVAEKFVREGPQFSLVDNHCRHRRSPYSPQITSEIAA